MKGAADIASSTVCTYHSTEAIKWACMGQTQIKDCLFLSFSLARSSLARPCIVGKRRFRKGPMQTVDGCVTKWARIVLSEHVHTRS